MAFRERNLYWDLSTLDMNMNISSDVDASAPGGSSSLGLSCGCGRYFSHQSALTNHTRSCKLSKKRLASALDIAQDVWKRRKKKKEERLPDPEAPMVIDDPSPIEVSFYSSRQQHFHQLFSLSFR